MSHPFSPSVPAPDDETDVVRELREFFRGHEHAADDVEWCLRWLQESGGEMLILASLLDSDEGDGLMQALWRGFGLVMATLRGVERQLEQAPLADLAEEAFGALERFWRGVLAHEVALPGLAELISESLDERAFVREIRETLGRGDLRGARSLLEGSELKTTSSLALRNFRRLLAPPSVTVSMEGALETRSDHAWLAEHAHAYRGQWIALSRGQLLGAYPSREELESNIDSEARERALLLQL